MRILVLHRGGLAATPYPDFVGPGHSVCVITDDDSARAEDGYGDVIHVEDMDSPRVEVAALEVHRDGPVQMVLALSEYDILRAARLRRHLGVAGQSVESATAFRDKLVMKQILSRAGVPVARYAEVSHVLDLVRFVDEVGYPVVVKPRLGAGSVGVDVLTDEEDLSQFVERAAGVLSGDESSHLIAESFVAGEMLHVDGVVRDGRVRLIWPFTHGASSTLDYRTGGSLVSCMVDRSDELWQRAVDLVRQALDALPTPTHAIFHAELFHTPTGELVLNEIASRMGGAKVHRSLRAAFGVSMTEQYLRAEVGLPAGPSLLSDPARLAGYLLIPPRAGRLDAVPVSCPLPGVEDFRVMAEAGAVLDEAAASVDSLLSVVVVGTSAEEVFASLRSADAWLRSRLLISEVENHA